MNAAMLRTSTSALRTAASARLAAPSSLMGARRSLMTLKDKKYTAHATARGQGRNGEVISDDDAGLTLRLAMPKSLGGKGDGQNPEQLFAMGYAACFLSALQLVAGQRGQAAAVKDVAVHSSVHLGAPEGSEGYAIAVDIRVEGIEDQELIDAGHAACPYSRALKHGAVVNVSKGKKGGYGEPGSAAGPDSGHKASEHGSSKSSGGSSSSKSESSGGSASKASGSGGKASEKTPGWEPKSAQTSGAPKDTGDAGKTQSGSGTAGYQ